MRPGRRLDDEDAAAVVDRLGEAAAIMRDAPNREGCVSRIEGRSPKRLRLRTKRWVRSHSGFSHQTPKRTQPAEAGNARASATVRGPTRISVVVTSCR